MRGTAVVASFALLLAAGALAQRTPLQVATVQYETVPRERIWNGTVEAVEEATVSAQTSGRVAEILYDVNDFVEAGAVIIRFTDVEQQAALRQAQGLLHEAEARFQEADTARTRAENMYASRTVSRSEYEQAVANRAATLARLEAARSGVTAAQSEVEHTVVRAPYAGIVSKRHVAVGERVGPGQALMSGLSLESLRVSVDVPQSLIDPIRRIGESWVYADGLRIRGARLTFFPVADSATNSFRVRVDLPAGAATLYPGTFTRVGFLVGSASRLLVPAASVVHRGELTALYVVDPQGRASLRQIRVGREYEGRIEVLAGLEAGEQVALDPLEAGALVKEPRADRSRGD